MNTLQYYLLNKNHEKEVLDELYLNDFYKYFEKGSNIFNFEIKVSDSDFKSFFSIIYDVLRFRLDLSQFSEVAKDYLRLIIYDSFVGENVDIKWLINHIWYLSYCSNNIDFSDYTDCIGYIQNRLVKEFDIQENLKQKVNRKVSTFLLK